MIFFLVEAQSSIKRPTVPVKWREGTYRGHKAEEVHLTVSRVKLKRLHGRKL